MIDKVRDIPLDAVLQQFGLTAKREGSTARYKRDGAFNIVVSPNKLWFDNVTGTGGRGVIDLALHLKCHIHPNLPQVFIFAKRWDWLAKLHVGGGVIPSQDTQPLPPKQSFEDQASRLAIRDDARWPMARHYLTKTRRLPGKLVDELAACNDVYASFSKSSPELTGVCFVHRNLDGLPRGATIRPATSERAGTFSIGEKTNAWFTLGFPNQSRRAVVVEAPIDAISYWAMKPTDETVVLAMSGAHVFPAVLKAAHERQWPLTVAFDNDAGGKTGWERCLENQKVHYPNDPPPSRMIPTAKDWNKDLCDAPRRTHGRRL